VTKHHFAAVLLCTAAAFAAPTPARASTEADAIAMVAKAVAVAKAEGDKKLIERINSKDKAFVDGELYAVVRDSTGTVIAHPTKASLVGKNLNDVPDADGKLFRQEITDGARTSGKGWVSYKSKNPTTNKVEAKKTYYQKAGAIIVEAGIYDAK
jgi:signal transduction histidine kinase